MSDSKDDPKPWVFNPANSLQIGPCVETRIQNSVKIGIYSQGRLVAEFNSYHELGQEFVRIKNRLDETEKVLQDISEAVFFRADDINEGNPWVIYATEIHSHLKGAGYRLNDVTDVEIENY